MILAGPVEFIPGVFLELLVEVLPFHWICQPGVTEAWSFQGHLPPLGSFDHYDPPPSLWVSNNNSCSNSSSRSNGQHLLSVYLGYPCSKSFTYINNLILAVILLGRYITSPILQMSKLRHKAPSWPRSYSLYWDSNLENLQSQ